jgi:hypothetical protein
MRWYYRFDSDHGIHQQSKKNIMNKVIKDFLIFAGQSFAFIVTAIIFVVLFTLLFGVIIAIFQ